MENETKTAFKIVLFLIFLAASVLVLGQNNISLAEDSATTKASLYNTNKKTAATTGAPVYTPMEEIPGMGKPTNFYDYVIAIYKFGIGGIGICAMLMIIIGGYMYMTSAGNNASMESAKGVITDAIVGLLLAFSSFLILYVINPDLVKIKKINMNPTLTTAEKASTGGTASSSGTGNGKCEVLSSGPCSVENLKSTFSDDAKKMSMICNKESRGNAALASSTDLCMDGNSFSIGLYQINIMTSANSIGCDGSTIFEGTGSRSSSYDCNDYKTNSNGVKYCAHRKCKVKAGQEATYASCKAKLMNGTTNIQAASTLFSNGKYNHWKTSASICGI